MQITIETAIDSAVTIDAKILSASHYFDGRQLGVSALVGGAKKQGVENILMRYIKPGTNDMVKEANRVWVNERVLRRVLANWQLKHTAQLVAWVAQHPIGTVPPAPLTPPSFRTGSAVVIIIIVISIILIIIVNIISVCIVIILIILLISIIIVLDPRPQCFKHRLAL